MNRHAGEDRHNRLDDDIFSYRVTKDGLVSIYWQNKRVMLLKANQAQKFLAKIAGLDGKDAQVVMAKLTGNFKRGNERTAASHNRAGAANRDND